MNKKLFLLSFFMSFTLWAAVHNVEMKGMKFVPDNINAKIGDTVIFTNKENMLHNVVSPENKIRSRFLKKGEKFEHKITEKNDIIYYCEPHRTMGMKGKINVK